MAVFSATCARRSPKNRSRKVLVPTTETCQFDTFLAAAMLMDDWSRNKWSKFIRLYTRSYRRSLEIECYVLTGPQKI